nr:thiamine phosphate synthase [Paenactinomyces guangxiensis]
MHVITEENQQTDDLLRLWPGLVPWVDYFHLRFKSKSQDQVFQIAKKILSHNLIPRSSLIINRHMEVAEQLRCGGVHLPEDTADWKIDNHVVAHIRRGRSVHSLESAIRAESDGMDYIMVGHIFPSRSKPGVPPMGLKRLEKIVAAVKIPVIAVGGIGPDQVADVMGAGCAGIAVISAVYSHPSPEQAVQQLKRSGEGG